MRAKALLYLLVITGFAIAPNGSARADCHWSGTSPFCSGECGDNETETMRTGSGNGTQGVQSTNTFGSDCLSGTKALCCHTQGRSCRWSGTAPLCAGSCDGNEKPAEPPQGSSSGAGCLTGSKMYCCISAFNPNPGSVRQGLASDPGFTRYAAIWDKSSGPQFHARHGLTNAQYQQEFNTLTQQGFRPVDVTGYAVGGQDHYAAIWEKSPGPEFQARHNLTAEQYQQTFDQLLAQGFRLVHVAGYNVNGQDRYAAIWLKTSGPPFVARHRLTADQYQATFNQLLNQGFRLVDVSGYSLGGQDHYAAIWEKSPGPEFQARHSLTSDQYQATFNELVKQGFRLVRVRGWGVGDTYHYAAIWEKSQGAEWVARHGMLSDNYQEEFDRLLKAGFRLRDVSGYQADPN
jgi:hypothetical protein